jgi:hypothetical protein
VEANRANAEYCGTAMGRDRRSCERAERSTELRAAGNMTKRNKEAHGSKQKAGFRGIRSVCREAKEPKPLTSSAEHNDLGLTKSDARR